MSIDLPIRVMSQKILSKIIDKYYICPFPVYLHASFIMLLRASQFNDKGFDLASFVFRLREQSKFPNNPGSGDIFWKFGLRGLPPVVLTPFGQQNVVWGLTTRERRGVWLEWLIDMWWDVIWIPSFVPSNVINYIWSSDTYIRLSRMNLD